MNAVLKAYANTPAGQVHYRWSDGPGLPLVFYHRAPATSASFLPLMKLMAGERPLYSFDIPGFGESFDPPGNPTMSDFADWMVAALDFIGIDKVHIFAHHTGTHIATEMADRYSNRVASLGLNGIAYTTAEERSQHAANMMKSPTPDEDGEYIINTFNMMKTLFPKFDPDLTPLEVIGALRSHYTRQKSFSAVWGQDYPAVLKAVKCPILATCAEDDVWAPVFERVFEDRPDARKVWLSKAMFLTPEYDALRVADVIREFLAEVESP